MKAFLVVCLATAVCAAPQVILANQGLYNTPIISSPIINTLPVTSYIAGQPLVQKVQKVEEQMPVEEKKVEVESYSLEEPAKKVEIQTPLVYTSGLPLTTYAHAPIAPVTYTTPLVQKVQVLPKYHAKNGEVEHIVAKREADPQVLLGANNLIAPSVYAAQPLVRPVVSTVAQPVVYTSAVKPVVAAQPIISAVQPVVYKSEVVDPLKNVEAKTYANNRNIFDGINYAAEGQYHAETPGTVHIAKRSADADPALVYRAGLPLAYNTWAAPVAAPLAYNAWAAPHVVESSAAAVKSTNLLTGAQVADYRFNGQNYASKGQYFAQAAGGVTHIAKRSADADPAVVYSNLGYSYGSLVRPSVYSSWARPAVYSSWAARPAVYGNWWY